MLEPPLYGAVQLIFINVRSKSELGANGASGILAAKMAPEDADCGPQPSAFLAITLKWYELLGRRVKAVYVRAAMLLSTIVNDTPSELWNTLQSITAVPPFEDGSVQDSPIYTSLVTLGTFTKNKGSVGTERMIAPLPTLEKADVPTTFLA